MSYGHLSNTTLTGPLCFNDTILELKQGKPSLTIAFPIHNGFMTEVAMTAALPVCM